MDPWVEHTGHPLLTVSRNNSGIVMVTQVNALDSESENTWEVPINYATRSKPDFSSTKPTHWVKRSNETLILDDIPKDDWILLNIQNTGTTLRSVIIIL